MKLDISILAVDDDSDVLLALKMLLVKHIAYVKTLNNPKLIENTLKEEFFDIILLDMNFTKDTISGEEGYHYLKIIKKISPETIVIFLTAYGDVEKAVRALKKGANDFILKPWQNEKLLATIHSAAQISLVQKENYDLKNKQKYLQERLSSEYNDIIGASNVMKDIFSLIDCVAPTDANVLITGENGTGKELIAKAIHNKSMYKDEMFLSVDLGSIPETLFESELFGHAKGAFTDAKNQRIGKFEAAKNGTLFLDEIGNLSLTQQAKLLTTIEKREVTPIGSNKNIQINVRLICATNSNIYELIKDNAFRQDLLYRINTVEIHLPPLRKRIDDIPLIAEHYLEIFKKKYKKDFLEFKQSATKFLCDYDWPGNIRELRHAIERSVILSKNHFLTEDDFIFLSNNINKESIKQTTLFNIDTPISNINSLDEIEKNLIISTLERFNGNISNTAKELGLTRAALYRRIKKYDI